MTALQKAIVIPEPQANFTLKIISIPAPLKGEVLVKVIAVGLNPMDPLRRRMNFLIDSYPAVMGSDVAGVIEEVGEGVEGWKKGDEIFAGALGGGYAEYTTMPAGILIRKPASVTFDEVATFPITFCTACVGLFAPAPIGVGLNPTFSWDKPQQGQSALVIGAGTSVGQFAVQLFKFLGFTRIVAYASTSHFEYLASLGATEIIDRQTTPLADLPSHPALSPAVDVVYNVLFALSPDSAQSVNISWDCVKDGGKVVTANPRAPLDRTGGKQVELCRAFGYYAGPDVRPPRNKAMPGYSATEAHTQFGRLIMRELPRMLEAGVIEANRIDALPNGLQGVIEAMGRWEKGEVSGVKMVGRPQETPA